LRKERDKNFQAAQRFRRMNENDIPWRGVRRRPQKISPGEARDSEGTRRFLPWREPHVSGGPLRSPETRKELGIADPFEPFAAFTLGYAASVPPSQSRERPEIVWA
jgi:hypothetical protein